MADWMHVLNGDAVSWLLEPDTPAVRHLALRNLLDKDTRDLEVRRALAEAMAGGPIAAILAAQRPEGYWMQPGPGYGPKYQGTVWQVIFLDQLGADGGDERVQRACAYVLTHSQTTSGGLGAAFSGETNPPPSAVLHCLNGNLLRALLGFGWLGDERVERVLDWQVRSITGEGFGRYYQSGTTAPGFACAANEKQPCAWGAVKALLALARVPIGKRQPHVQRAIDVGAAFLLSRDPAVADYPIPSYASRPNASWFKLGFPSAYVTDVLQNLEALCEAGFGKDTRLQKALQWLLSKQDSQGRWRNEYAYNGKTHVDVEKQGASSKWVTLRACRVLKTVYS